MKLIFLTRVMQIKSCQENLFSWEYSTDHHEIFFVMIALTKHQSLHLQTWWGRDCDKGARHELPPWKIIREGELSWKWYFCMFNTVRVNARLCDMFCTATKSLFSGSGLYICSCLMFWETLGSIHNSGFSLLGEKFLSIIVLSFIFENYCLTMGY